MNEIRKFDNYCRDLVIAELESFYDTELCKNGKRDIWRTDKAGKSYWVLGGVEYWHGIPCEMVEAERARPTDGILIIAILKADSIDIYSGKIGVLIQNLDRLPRAKESRAYQFNSEEKWGSLFLKEVPTLSLEHIKKLEFTGDLREKSKSRKSQERLLRGLGYTEEEIKEYWAVLDTLKKKQLH